MKLPNDVIIPRAKLTKYLLVWQEVSDKSKFLAKAGYTLENPDLLENAIRDMIALYEAVPDGEDQYGTYYRVRGILKGTASHGNLFVVTIWIVRFEEDNQYRFVTLKPWRNSNDPT